MKKNVKTGKSKREASGRENGNTSFGNMIRNSKQDMEFGKAMEADMERVDREMDTTEGLFSSDDDKEKNDPENGYNLELVDRMYSPDTDPDSKDGIHGSQDEQKKKKR